MLSSINLYMYGRILYTYLQNKTNSWQRRWTCMHQSKTPTEHRNINALFQKTRGPMDTLPKTTMAVSQTPSRVDTPKINGNPGNLQPQPSHSNTDNKTHCNTSNVRKLTLWNLNSLPVTWLSQVTAGFSEDIFGATLQGHHCLRGAWVS